MRPTRTTSGFEDTMMESLLYIGAMVLAVLLIFSAAILATLMLAKQPRRRPPRR